MPPSNPQLLLDHWLDLGNTIPWMELAVDPPFNRESFVICASRAELVDHLLDDEHPLGRAFVLADICFINLYSLPAADEWLAIKGRVAIGNISLSVRTALGDLDRAASRRRILDVVDLLQQCSEAECAEPGFRDQL